MFSSVLKKCGSVGISTVFVGYSPINIVYAQGERENAIKSLREEIKILLKKDISEEEIGKAIAGIKDKEVLKKIYEDEDYCRHIASMLVANVEEQNKVFYFWPKKILDSKKPELNVLTEERLKLREKMLKTFKDSDFSIKDIDTKIDNWIWAIPDRFCGELCETGAIHDTKGNVKMSLEDITDSLTSYYEWFGFGDEPVGTAFRINEGV